MIVSDFILSHVSASDIASTSLGDQLTCTDLTKRAAANAKILSYINLGVINLHRKFPLDVKAVIKDVYSSTRMYTLRDVNLLLLLSVIDGKGKELRFPQIVGVDDYDIKEVVRGTYLLTNPVDGDEITFLYTSTPQPLTLDSEIPLPNAMLEALLDYICYRAAGLLTINLGSDTATNRQGYYWQRFLGAVNELINAGYASIDEPLAKMVDRDL